MKKTLPFKTIKKKIALVDTRSDLYLILRFLCVPLDEAHVPLVVRVPHFENHCSRAYMGETSVTFGARPFTDACGYGLLRIYLCLGVGFQEVE